MEFLLAILMSVGAAAAAAVTLRRDRALLKAGKGERAFEETLAVMPFDRSQIARLRPLVEQVGVVRVPAPLDSKRGSISAGSKYEVNDTYEVFVLDSLGEVHDVHVTRHEAQAMELARELAEQLDAAFLE